MVKNKISGTVASGKSAYYCSTNQPIEVRRITYGKGGRQVIRTNKELAVRRNKCISYSGGKDYTLSCSTCSGSNKRQSCNKKEDELQDVYIL